MYRTTFKTIEFSFSSDFHPASREPQYLQWFTLSVWHWRKQSLSGNRNFHRHRITPYHIISSHCINHDSPYFRMTMNPSRNQPHYKLFCAYLLIHISLFIYLYTFSVSTCLHIYLYLFIYIHLYRYIYIHLLMYLFVY